ncbi:kinase-like protein [Armillaria novae-zelandiae]|uniref:Kinase-like protein n=1 Tax=Armillaria novae-zelandiae TaxID=153914 RepID=A0AA39PVI2_9AGAR|nr:kinase-like protein [Armillaria novae-zelandiae]
MRPRRSLLQILASSLLGLPWRLWLCFPKSMRASVYIRLGRWYSIQEWNIQRLPFGLILKHTQDRPPEIEADNIKFVQENTTIPVPRILDVLPDIPKGNTSGGGSPAKTTYPPEFLHYSDLIFELSELMKSFNKPVSGLHGSPFVHIRCGDRCLVQPLKNIRSFHDMLLANVSFMSRMPRLLQMASPVYAKPHKLCFSHCDLNHTNILVTEDGQLAAIIDWEAAGWFPEYWEYTSQVMQSVDSEILAKFWNAVGVFEKGCYEKELELERALWHSTGDTAVPPGIMPDDPLDIPLHEDKNVKW